jgi:hypothetical protein
MHLSEQFPVEGAFSVLQALLFCLELSSKQGQALKAKPTFSL